MANPDLRDWLAQMEAAGELQKVSGADRKEEIGGIVDIYQRETNRPALLFDEIPGYPRKRYWAGGPMEWGRRFLPTSGASAYIDSDHLEINLPEHTRAEDHAAMVHAGLIQ